MGHDQHFLERLDRLSAEQVDLALSLYRDERLVRYLVDRAALAKGEARFAVALGNGGPYLVLARDGHFVTCLAEGMSPVGLSVRTRAWLDEAAEAHEELRTRLVHGRTVTGDQDETGALMGAIYARAERLPREEFRALNALAPVLGAATLGLFGRTIALAERVQPGLAKLRGVRTPVEGEGAPRVLAIALRRVERAHAAQRGER